MKRGNLLASLIAGCFVLANAQEAPTGSAVSPDDGQRKALASLAGKMEGYIVWSSSRSNRRHDLWAVNADATKERQLTKGDMVDWFPRISPDGSTVLFARSKFGWEAEGDADIFDKWDLWTVGSDGMGEKKVVENAVWGTWRPGGDSIVFARGPKVFIKALAGEGEKELFDAGASVKKGTNAQQPSLSPDGRLLAVTLRGTKRDCGIWNLVKNQWNTFGGGCQITWFPGGKRVLRVNEGMGNGSTEVLAFNVDADGRPVEKIALSGKVRFMDLAGRRSHEYFPKLDPVGQWMVWAATQTGHEHDIEDYELYLWNISTDKKKGPVRLTFHTGNDRWPDIFIGSPVD
jgi:Tol biopolymer transport system component